MEKKRDINEIHNRLNAFAREYAEYREDYLDTLRKLKGLSPSTISLAEEPQADTYQRPHP